MDFRHGTGRLGRKRAREAPDGSGRVREGTGEPEAELVSGGFRSISAGDLRSDERLADLYVEAVRREWWPNSNADVLEFWCLAEKALGDDVHGTPGKLFHALVKRKDTSRVTNEHERRAQRRMRSDDREALAGRARAVPRAVPKRRRPEHGGRRRDVVDEEATAALLGREGMGFVHGVMMMCFLPQKRLPAAQRDYTVKHGRALLHVEAGSLLAPGGDEMKACPVPFGTRARLILPHINGYAVRNRTPIVDMGASLRQFLGKLGMGVDGRRGVSVVEQVEAIAAARIVLGTVEEDRMRTRYRNVADGVSFWLDRDERQRRLWEPELELSREYYEALLEHPVPVDLGHLSKLARSPRRMDIYSWLAYRTANIPSGREVRIKIDDLRAVFGEEFNRARDFRKRIEGDLRAIARVHADFRVEVRGDIVALRRSPPPVKVVRVAGLGSDIAQGSAKSK